MSTSTIPEAAPPSASVTPTTPVRPSRSAALSVSSSSPGSGRWKVALPAEISSKAMVRLPRDRGHLGRDDDAHAFAQLVVVRVDLAGPLGRQGHEGELRVDLVEKILDRRIHERVAG
jgi:hypothetical protein